jgi:phosphatidylglycerophosphatase C
VNTRRLGVAAFDVDGTLTTTDCVVPFLRRVAGVAPVGWSLLRSPAASGRSLLARDRDALKALAARGAFTGRPLAEVEAVAEPFATEVADERLRDDVLARLRAHQATGDVVVLVSASFEVYLRPLADRLGIDDVLGTRLEVDDAGVLTGRLEGANCRGPEKVRRLHGWLERRGVDRAATHVTAYGDSAGDRQLLADADVAHWVGSPRGVPR